ncbi:alpha/beta-hydrolase [Rhizoclosmatium globosum]|uniref:Alpha/beta-hydrolase n=1 Tax=Rhizoclosmatium globosum TaxID=329046 RepID=A0A1Y2CBJ6_9FUNG|nr:alpha/beta-hydrolase [Rhizoclosmatium globosum]|eukprot:ORY44421.1 alpha/beta-hydrolase [Rhizoclosmatium globosum]
MPKPIFDIKKDNPPGGYFGASIDKHEIYFNVWKPTGEVKAKVLFFHGFGEHIHRYEHVFTKFAEAGIMVKGMDYRGHGRTVYRNNAVKGFLPGTEQVCDDMIQLNELPVPGIDETNIPTFLFGHSFGGVLALTLVQDPARLAMISNFRGMVVQAPALLAFQTPGKVTPVFLQKIIDLLGGVLGKIAIPAGVPLDVISSDKDEQEKYKNDSLNHGSISFRLARLMMVRLPKSVPAKSATVNCPILVYHSVCDRLTDSSVSKAFVEAVASTDKKWHGFTKEDGLQHELHNEPRISGSIITDYIKWILERAQ